MLRNLGCIIEYSSGFANLVFCHSPYIIFEKRLQTFQFFLVHGTHKLFIRIYEKKQPACKPGSVPRLAAKCLPFIYACCHQQALAVYPPTWGEQPS